MSLEEREFCWRLDQWFPFLSEKQKVSFLKQRDLILQYRDKINLISKNTLKEIDKLHFADSILGSQLIQNFLYKSFSVCNDVLYDFGSGNGFPGIVFSILYPNYKVCLVEINGKKAELLKQFIYLLKLKNTFVFYGDAMSIKKGSVVLAMTRAYKPIANLLFTHNGVFSSHAHVFHFKGKNWEKEKAPFGSQYVKRWGNTLLGKYHLPDESIKKEFYIIKSSCLSFD